MPPARNRNKQASTDEPGEPIHGQLEVADALAPDPQPDDGPDGSGAEQPPDEDPGAVVYDDDENYRDPGPEPLPTAWMGLLAPLGSRNANGRTLAVPAPGQPPLPQLPLPLYYDADPDDAAGPVRVGWIDRVWIDDASGAPALSASGRLDHQTEHGPHVADRLARAALAVHADVEQDSELAVKSPYHPVWTLTSATLVPEPVEPNAVIWAV
jgi:hypothetical protein